MVVTLFVPLALAGGSACSGRPGTRRQFQDGLSVPLCRLKARHAECCVEEPEVIVDLLAMNLLA